MSTKLRLSTPANFTESADLLLEPSHPLSEYEPSGAKRRSAEREGCRWLWGKAVLNPDGGVAPCVSSWFRGDDLGTWDSAVSFHSIWNGPSYMQARSLARTGGDPHGSSICAQCAYHRNFVPTPDTDDEPLPTPTVLGELAGRLIDAGVQVSAAVRSALEQELAPSR
jgi:MoaA/NifB/PqqE/SkfB family radical SAM enzyme